MSETDPRPEIFGRIMVDVGAITSEGLTPGTGEKRLEFTPTQLRRLVRWLDQWEAVEALALIVEHGEIMLDPLRIEVSGWKREWLMQFDMRENQARKAVRRLNELKFMEPVYGSKGAAGARRTVLNGSFFGWQSAVTEVVAEDGSRRRVISASRVDNPASVQVSTLGQDSPEREIGPVENPVWAFGQDSPERPDESGFRGRQGESRPNAPTTNAQVSASGQGSPERPSPAPTRKEGSEEEESLLAADPAAAGPLTRPNLHRFLAEAAIREAVTNRQDQAVLALADLFQRKPQTTTSALEFFNRPVGDLPHLDLAWFLVDLLTRDASTTVEAAESLKALLRTKGAKIPKRRPDEFLRDMVITLVASTDTTVDRWSGFVVWAFNNPRWHTSRGLTDLVNLLNDLAEAQATPPAEAGLPPRPPSRRPLSPAEEEKQARGEDYWDWLREEVFAGTEFADDYSFEANVRRSLPMQDRYIRLHRRRQTG